MEFVKDRLMKCSINEACQLVTDMAKEYAKNEIDLFCIIMGYPKSEVNRFIGDDPHGVVDIMEGYRIFNMTDIHVVISEYEHWMSIYKTNEELRKSVDAWYFYCQEWYEKHSCEEQRWVNAKERFPNEGEIVNIYTMANHTGIAYRNDGSWCGNDVRLYLLEDRDVTYWKPILTPKQEAESRKSCPNLRSWLAGCPVDGLREATPEWKEEQRNAQEAAHQRVEECKQALCQAIEEEVKLNKF